MLLAFTASIAFGAKPHPNEKLLVGKWRPVSVEKVIPEKSAAKTGTVETPVKTDERSEQFMRNEQRTTLEITADKTAAKEYHGKLMKFTWKLKGKGKKMVARNLQTKEKYVLNIVEVTAAKLILIETLPAGTLKITYAKE